MRGSCSQVKPSCEIGNTQLPLAADRQTTRSARLRRSCYAVAYEHGQRRLKKRVKMPICICGHRVFELSLHRHDLDIVTQSASNAY
jgi:hypothetical protein